MVHVPISRKKNIARLPKKNSSRHLIAMNIDNIDLGSPIGHQEWNKKTRAEGRKDSGQSFELLNYRPPPGPGDPGTLGPDEMETLAGPTVAKQGCLNSNNSGKN